MAFLQYLNFNGEDIPEPSSYDIGMSDIEADSGGITEAGTTQRDVVREGVVEIKVSFLVTKKWLMKLSTFKKEPKLTVRYLDTATMLEATTEMYITGFGAKLHSDTSYGSLWDVSFSLKEF